MFSPSESGHAVARTEIAAQYARRLRTTLVAILLVVTIPLGVSPWIVAAAIVVAMAVDGGFWWARNRVKGLLSPELANAALDLLPAVFFVLDQSGRIQYWNARFSDLSGQSFDDLYGRRLYRFFKGDDRQSVVVAVTRALTRGSSTVEAEFATEDGRTIPMLLTGIRVNLGGTYRLIGVGQDISARKEAEAELRRQEARYRLLAENVTDVVTHLDPDTTLLYVSPSVEDLLGFAPEEITGEQAIRLVHPDDRRRCRRGVVRALRQGRRPRVEFRIRTKNRGYLWVESVGKELEGEEARRGLVITTRDISERKARERDLVQARDTAEAARKEAERARKDAEQANRLKSAFLANMSHEIRTPLTSVIGFSEVLEEEVEADYARFARLIRQSSTRLKDVLNSVLRLSKLEVGAVEFEPEKMDLATEVERTVKLLQPQADDKDLTLRMETPDELPARLDPGATGRILDNLVSNAIKYTPDGGTVEVRLQSDDEWARLEVDDTGEGINEDFLPNLFEPFVQAPGEDGRDEGSGLGLAITKRLVEGMGGDIDVETEPGVGTCFTVRFDRGHAVVGNGAAKPDDETGGAEPAGAKAAEPT
jgi:PAS domain S-box-containing protein